MQLSEPYSKLAVISQDDALEPYCYSVVFIPSTKNHPNKAVGASGRSYRANHNLPVGSLGPNPPSHMVVFSSWKAMNMCQG